MDITKIFLTQEKLKWKSVWKCNQIKFNFFNVNLRLPLAQSLKYGGFLECMPGAAAPVLHPVHGCWYSHSSLDLASANHTLSWGWGSCFTNHSLINRLTPKLGRARYPSIFVQNFIASLQLFLSINRIWQPSMSSSNFIVVIDSWSTLLRLVRFLPCTCRIPPSKTSHAVMIMTLLTA